MSDNNNKNKNKKIKTRIKLSEVLQKILKNTRNYKKNNIDYENVKTILKNDKNAILIDVRSPQEYKEGHLGLSINIPLYDLERDIDNILNKDKTKTIILYCQSGNRSNKALQILKDRNYKNLYQIEGGLDNIK